MNLLGGRPRQAGGSDPSFLDVPDSSDDEVRCIPKVMQVSRFAQKIMCKKLFLVARRVAICSAISRESDLVFFPGNKKTNTSSCCFRGGKGGERGARVWLNRKRRKQEGGEKIEQLSICFCFWSSIPTRLESTLPKEGKTFYRGTFFSPQRSNYVPPLAVSLLFFFLSVFASCPSIIVAL